MRNHADPPVFNRADLREQLKRYENEMHASGLQESASSGYVGSALRFIRWLEGDYRPRNASGDTRPLSSGPWTPDALTAELHRYREVLLAAGLRPLAIQTYIHSVSVFLRWMAGTYRPMARRDGRPTLRTTLSEPDSSPFVRYERGGVSLLGIPATRDGSARHGYGPPVFNACGYKCAYCGFDMARPYENWLNLSVNHVVPQHLVKFGWPAAWLNRPDQSRHVLRACNEFLNGYRLADVATPISLEDFVDLRDGVFLEKLRRAQARHAVERERFLAARPAGPTDAQEAASPVEPELAGSG